MPQQQALLELLRPKAPHPPYVLLLPLFEVSLLDAYPELNTSTIVAYTVSPKTIYSYLELITK
jgi:hypothetical protein